jgi:hypothetical protein
MIGVLSMNGLGRWVIVREGRVPYELSSGSTCLIEVDGVLRLTRIEYSHGDRPGYHSIDGYKLAVVCAPQRWAKLKTGRN